MGAAQAWPTLKAGNNILPSTFLMGDPSNDYGCLQATLNAPIVGISQVGTNYAPGVLSGTQYAAQAGQQVQTFGIAERCNLLAGTGGWGRWNLLKSDANGAGIPANSGDNYGALALTNTAAGEYGDVIMVLESTRPVVASGIVAWTANGNISAANSGSTNIINAQDLTLTLPTAVDGLSYTFILTNNAVGGSVGFLLNVTGSDRVMGNGITSSATHGIKNVFGTIREGDGLALFGTTQGGRSGWYVRYVEGTWVVN